MSLRVGLTLLILAEIVLFVEIGALIGVWATLAWVVGTGVAGVAIVRTQGRQMLQHLMTGARESRASALPVGDRMAVVVAGGLLVLPGFLTDLAGLVLLVPVVRHRLLRRLGATVSGASTFTDRGASGEIIEGEAEEVPLPDRPSRRDPALMRRE